MPHFKADLGHLVRIREFVTDAADKLGVDAAVLDDLRLAVDEAATNIIVHGYVGSGEIEVELSASGADLVVRLCDQAPAFDPLSRLADTIEPLGENPKPGGFGLYLIGQAMDEISYRRVDGSNELTMIKRGAI